MALCNECRRGLPCLSDPSCNGTVVSILTIEEASDDTETPAIKPRARNQKRDAALKDQQSTGRKRAARAYPLDRSLPCEWRNKMGQGGGPHPIEGCTEGMQLNRHHGPDKNTLNNESGNVHRICAHCHNRWHSINDPDYVPGQILKD
jgi:hypothetical protein